MTLDAPSHQGPWTMRVTNDGGVPVILAADARLLWLEVTPRGERKPLRCELPADLRPASAADRALVLPPGRAYVETFEPRLYCFGDRLSDAMGPTSIVVAHLGWPKASKDLTRNAVTPIDGVQPVVAALPSLEAPPVAVPDDPTPSRISPDALATTAGPSDASPASVARLALTSSRAVDVSSWGSVPITVTLRNEGTRPVRVRFRPDTLDFDVSGPSGAFRCAWPGRPSAPTSEVFDTLAPGARATLEVLLGAYCPRTAFGSSGLMIVRAELDTRDAGAAELGFTPFQGEVLATRPTVLRLHQGSADAAPPPRPGLADAQ